MYKDSYNQRLKEIREKYGAAVKDTTSCLRSNDKPSLKLDSKYEDKYADKYALNKKLIDNSYDRKYSENHDPSLTSLSSKYSSSILKENDTGKNYDSFLHTQTKDERLKEIELMRKEFAQSRKKAVDDFNRTVEKSKSKILESQKYGGLKQRVNNTTTFNPEDFRVLSKETSAKEGHRGRTQSNYSAMQGKPDLQLNRELRRNYDYNYKNESSTKDMMDSDPKTLSSFRNNSVSRFEREREFSSVKKDFAITDNFRSMKQIDSETTSPIRGLMKFDSLEKPKRTQVAESYISASKLPANNYDLTNIDKIQDRIHKILAKK